MTLRADRSILSVFALATALAVSGVAGAQPYSRPMRPDVAQPWSMDSQDAQSSDDDARDWRGQEPQGRDFQEQGPPEQEAPEQDFQNQEPEQSEPEERGQEERGQDGRRDQDDRRGAAPDHPDARRDDDGDRGYDQEQPRTDAPDDGADDVSDDDMQQTLRTDRSQQIITLYHEPPTPPLVQTPSAQAPSAQALLPHAQTPDQAQTGAQAGAAAAGGDITASISPAPSMDAARDQAAPASPLPGETPRANDAMRPAVAAPADPAPAGAPGGARPVEPGQAASIPQGGSAFPELPPPPEVDASALQAASLLERARALLETPAAFAGSRLDAAQQAELRKFYAERTAPLWIERGQWTAAARAVQGKLEHAWEEGMEPADYPAADLPTVGATPDVLAAAEIRQSVNAVKYARDASGGRIDLPRLSRLITPKLDLPGAASVLNRLADAGKSADADALLGDYNPKHPGYVALRGKLIELRAARPPEPPVARVPEGPALRVGMSDPRVSLVRSRLGLTPSEDVLYDGALATAVAEFQRQRGLKPTGVLTRQTVVAMAGDRVPAAQDETALVVNMERWRWLPRDLGPNYIFVNIPEYRMRVVRDGHMTHEARVVVGKAETPTPVFSDTMQYAVVNPYWNVPPSILKKEFLPGLARDPNYAARRGYEVVRRGNSIHVRQPPGERNALGHIKFMFPNDHAVYLHDTPSRALFGRDRRAFSHGCVRVDDPLRFAELVLGPQWPQTRIKKMIGRGERTVRLQEPLPIHLAYFTASVDGAGKLHAREDIYGLDRRMQTVLSQTHR
ncbi:L,D-transpeptidase family protein [Camelimonas sp. ID_303_24]